MRTSKPVFPEGYGVPEKNDLFLPWSFAEERLTRAMNYWVCTVRPNGTPHCTPVWGVWLGDTLYIEGSIETRRGKNLKNNPSVSVHLESGTEVVILEGKALEVPHPDPELGRALSAAYTAKYGPVGYSPGPDSWNNGGLFTITPRAITAWNKFPDDATRFHF